MKQIISISASAAPEILKAMQANNIATHYMGLDQEGRLIMEISYQPDQAPLVKDLLELMANVEELIYELSQAFTKILKEKSAKLDEQIEVIKKRWQERKSKTETDGNE